MPQFAAAHLRTLIQNADDHGHQFITVDKNELRLILDRCEPLFAHAKVEGDSAAAPPLTRESAAHATPGFTVIGSVHRYGGDAEPDDLR